MVRSIYVAALDRPYGAGVTKENNAAILLYEALGSRFIPPDPPGLRLRLGLGEPPRVSDEDVSIESFVAGREEARAATLPTTVPAKPAGPASRRTIRTEDPLEKEREEQYRNRLAATTRPWKEQDYPVVTAWLKSIDGRLDLLVAATKRPRYYVPLVTKEPPHRLFNVALPRVSDIRGMGHALSARAMLRLSSGDTAGGWSDVMALARLARLVGQAPDLLHRLLGVLFHGMATSLVEAAAIHGNLSPEQARAFLADIESLAPLHNPGEALDRYERFIGLDALAMMAQAFNKGKQGRQDLPSFSVWRLLIFRIDWNKIGREINKYWDAQAAAAKEGPYADRVAAGAAAKKLEDAFLRRFSRPAWLNSPQQMMSNALFTVVAISTTGITAELEQDLARTSLSRVVMALAAYKAEHGEYPPDLNALVPSILKEVPPDRFTDKPLAYRRQGEGYVLYSVGPNLRDDGGSGREGSKENDDIVTEVK